MFIGTLLIDLDQQLRRGVMLKPVIVIMLPAPRIISMSPASMASASSAIIALNLASRRWCTQVQMLILESRSCTGDVCWRTYNFNITSALIFILGVGSLLVVNWSGLLIAVPTSTMMMLMRLYFPHLFI